MNKYLCFLLLFFIFLNSCKDEADPESAQINLTELSFEPAASYKSFIIKSNTKWTVESSDAWFTCEPTSGESNRDITVRVTENVVIAERGGKITIKDGNGQIIDEVTVVQLGVTPNLVVPATASFEPEGGEIRVQVTATPATLAWTAQIPAGSFVSEKSKTSNEIVFEAASNETDDRREVVITFQLTGFDKTAQITIAQAPKEKPAEIITIGIPVPGTRYTQLTNTGGNQDANETDWKQFIPEGNRFILPDHVISGTGTSTSNQRGLAVILIKNETDQPTGPIEFKLEGFDPDAATVRWDQNALFEGNNYTRDVVNGIGTPMPAYNLKAGIDPGEEIFVVFRIRNTAIPQNTPGEYKSKFTITGEGIDIEGTLEITVVP